MPTFFTCRSHKESKFACMILFGIVTCQNETGFLPVQHNLLQCYGAQKNTGVLLKRYVTQAGITA